MAFERSVVVGAKYGLIIAGFGRMFAPETFLK